MLIKKLQVNFSFIKNLTFLFIQGKQEYNQKKMKRKENYAIDKIRRTHALTHARKNTHERTKFLKKKIIIIINPRVHVLSLWQFLSAILKWHGGQSAVEKWRRLVPVLVH